MVERNFFFVFCPVQGIFGVVFAEENWWPPAISRTWSYRAGWRGWPCPSLESWWAWPPRRGTPWRIPPSQFSLSAWCISWSFHGISRSSFLKDPARNEHKSTDLKSPTGLPLLTSEERSYETGKFSAFFFLICYLFLWNNDMKWWNSLFQIDQYRSSEILGESLVIILGNVA